MDKSFRDEMLAKISPDAQAQASLLKSLTREYSLDEVAILTRAGPAKSLGLQDLGHLGVGARGDITVYRDEANREEMFATPEYVFKNGELVVKNGKVVKVVQGATHVVRPEFDKGSRSRSTSISTAISRCAWTISSSMTRRSCRATRVPSSCSLQQRACRKPACRGPFREERRPRPPDLHSDSGARID